MQLERNLVEQPNICYKLPYRHDPRLYDSLELVDDQPDIQLGQWNL